MEAHQEDIEEFPSPPKTPRDLSRLSRGRMDASWVMPDMPVPHHYPVVCTSQGQAEQLDGDDEELVDILMSLAEEGANPPTPSQPSSSAPCTSTPLTSAAPPFLPPAPSTPASLKRCSVAHEGKRCWRVATQQCSSYKCKKSLCIIHARVREYGRKAPLTFQGKLIYSCPSPKEMGLTSVSGQYHPCRTPPQIHHMWYLVLPFPDPNVNLVGEGTPFRWENDPIRSPNPILATEVDQKWGTQTTIEGNVEEVRRWWVVEEEREDREMVELDKTREAMDKVEETEFPEDSYRKDS